MKEPDSNERIVAVEAGIESVQRAWYLSSEWWNESRSSVLRWQGMQEVIDGDDLCRRAVAINWVPLLESQLVYSNRQRKLRLPGLGMGLATDVTQRLKWLFYSASWLDLRYYPSPSQVNMIAESFRQGFLSQLRQPYRDIDGMFKARSVVKLVEERFIADVPSSRRADFLHTIWQDAMAAPQHLSDEAFSSHVMLELECRMYHTYGQCADGFRKELHESLMCSLRYRAD